jgi:hypothetical protein
MNLQPKTNSNDKIDMKKLMLFGVGCSLLSMTPHAAQAGLSVGVHFGSSYRHSSGSVYVQSPVFCAPPPRHRSYGYYSYRQPQHCYPPVVYYPSYATRERVVVVREREPERVVVRESSDDRYSRSQTTQEENFYQLGYDWAKDLRSEVSTREEFTSYLKSHITKASLESYDAFRKGFLAGYGVNAAAAFDKAFQKARGN